MADLNKPADQQTWPGEGQKIPGMLNVLTILTYIGCGLGVLGGFYSYFTVRSSYEKLIEMQGKIDSLPEFSRRFLTPEAIELARKSLENRLPVLIISMVSILLCAYGAAQMRQLKKMGFGVYVIGEVLPIIAGALYLGAGSFSGLYLLGSIVPIVFIILYATQTKYLR
jgi:hypothetical protein